MGRATGVRAQYDKTSGYDGRIDPRIFLNQARLAAMGERSDIARRLANLYAAKVSWVDHWFGVLLETLEETHLLDHTAVIVTADHGTNVGQGGVFGKSYPITESEGHVPLMIRAPGLGSGRRGIGDDLVRWLRSEGEGPFPETLPGRETPPGWRTYWRNVYNKW